MDLFAWGPPEPGRPAPRLSLTADDGAWVRSEDMLDRVNVVLLFFRSLDQGGTGAWLRGFDGLLPRLQELGAVVFGVTHHRPEKLRAFRGSLDLRFGLLYDPLALGSRAFGCAGRFAPLCRDGVVVVDRAGALALAARGRPGPERVIEVLAAGTAPPGREAASAGGEGRAAASAVRDIGPAQAQSLLQAAGPRFVLVDVRTRAEHDADHVPGALHIPVDEIPHRHREIGQTSHIVCVGQTGTRSAAAAEFLASIGCTEVYNVRGGMSSWTGERVTGGRRQG